MAVRVDALRLYPVKALRGHAVASAMLERCGFAGDRRWMVVNPEGRFLSQRVCPAMARVSVAPDEHGLRLVGSEGEALRVGMPEAGAGLLDVTVWRSTVTATDAGDAAAAWLEANLGLSCRLVYLHDPDARPVDRDYGEDTDRVSFADGFPVLLASEASLADLNTRLSAKVPMARFRPNLVVAGAEAWQEDHWRRIQIGSVVFRLPKPCSRCAVTTVDQESGERLDGEPLRTLGLFRRTAGGAMFGQNMIPETTGRIAVGDPITVLEAGPSNVVPIP